MAVLRGFNCFAVATERHLSSQLLLTRAWSQLACTSRLDNISEQAIHVKEIVLFEGALALPVETRFYGDGFQMLAQTGGTIGQPQAIGRCSDSAHYRLSNDDGFTTCYNYILLSPSEHHHLLLGFTACHRFSGAFRLGSNGLLSIVLDLENLPLAAKASWQGEPLMVLEGSEPEDLLQEYANSINQHHPARSQKLSLAKTPTGWCSWYHYYAEVAEQDISENLLQMQNYPELDYLLIDDGYQAYMGDWLSSSPRFSSGLVGMVKQIQQAGKKAALWLAPFIAETHSTIFQQHPDWFVKDGRGKPLAAERVTYGGWRCTPWYVLDGTHPEVQKHLYHLMNYLSNELNIKLFKLDANFWGAIHGGHFYDPNATRIEAYRRGMLAISDGAGSDSFLLGCNAPMWPSLGLVDGMRIGDDVERNGGRFSQIAQEVLHRCWQNRRLWLCDPDCITLQNIPHQSASADEYRLHLVTLLACDGLLIAGDRLKELNADNEQLMRKVLNSEFIGRRLRLTQADYSQAEIQHHNNCLHLLFNWRDSAQVFQLPLSSKQAVSGFFGDEVFNVEPAAGRVSIEVPLGSAAALIVQTF